MTSCLRIASVTTLLALALAAACGDNLGDSEDLAIKVTPANGLHTTEGGGTATFTVALAAAPRSEVTIDVSSLDPAEGTVSPAKLTFDASNFSIPVTVTITGVDDAVDDGDQDFEVKLAASAQDGATASATVSVTNDDNDGIGVTVTPTELMTTESGDSATFTVVLDAQPTATVTIPIASSATAEGTVDVASLTFTTVNWNAPQTVTVTGVDDAIADGPQSYMILVGPATSDDPAYDDVDPTDVTVINVDNDSPGIIVTPTSGLVTTEGGGTATFSVVLASQPTADVSISLTSSDPGEGTTVSSLTFTSVNWDAPQIVTVTGVDDTLDDGDQSYTIVLAPATSGDAGYVGLDAADVSATNTDDEAPGFIVTPTSGLVTSEAGGTDSFTVALISAPTADVTVAVSSNNPGEGTASVTSLTFTPTDFAVPQTVTVTGVNDAIADGNQPYQIVLAPATSTDAAYAGFDPPDVSVTNTDNDSPGITVRPLTGLLVSELGDTTTFTVVLNSQPIANVTLPIASNDTTEGTVSPSSLVFTPANWDVPRTVTVTGVDDNLADGNQLFQAAVGVAVSADPNYNGINPPNPQVTNFDDDVATVVVRSAPIIEVSESGGTATFSIVLTTQPTADVRCAVSTSNSNEGVVNPLFTVFTPANFDQDHSFTVTGVDDAVVDGSQLFQIITAACTSLDPDYNGLNPRDVNARNLDND